jgi:hypothetical protein
MEQSVPATPADLTGTVDERRRQLSQLAPDSLSPEWLRRQLDAALDAWAADETEVDIQKEAHIDY